MKYKSYTGGCIRGASLSARAVWIEIIEKDNTDNQLESLSARAVWIEIRCGNRWRFEWMQVTVCEGSVD